MKLKLKPYSTDVLNYLNREEHASIHVLEKNKQGLDPEKPRHQQTLNEFR